MIECPPLSRRSPSILPIIVIAGFSGFAGLGYEMVWTRLFANSFGHEIVAVLGVLAALFGGLALGSLFLGRRISASDRPGIWYAGLEAAIGVWALVLIPVLPALGGMVPVLTPIDTSPLRQWAVAFALPSIILLPATLAMGATLPALEAILAPRVRAGNAVGWVYAANTFGAVAGTVATMFLIMPFLGLSRTLLLCASVNAACAAAMAAYWKRTAPPRAVPILSPAKGTPVASHRLAALFMTGLLGIGYEVIAVRTLSQLLENTVYTFAALLSVYLFGTAIGAALRNRLMRHGTRRPIDAYLAAAACLCCVCGTVALGHADVIQSGLSSLMPRSITAAIAAEFGIATIVFLLPTIAMGALFAQLAQAARDRDGGLGPAMAANTAGAALAPILFGPVLLPLLGAKLALVLIAAGYAFTVPRPRRAEFLARALAASVALSLMLTSLSLRYVEIPPGGEVLWYRDGIMAAVSVVRNQAGDHYLAVNNLFRLGGTASIRSDYREADIPLLLHPDPRRALFLGLGTGATISAAGDYPKLVADGVELVPEVVESFALFAKSAPNLGHNPNLRIHVADARRYVQATPDRYDVVVADVYHPWIDGTATLYTREHFAAIRALLAQGGLFCQWLPLHQLDLPTLRVIIRTFQAEFPNSNAYLAQFSIETPLVALIGSAAPRTYPGNWLQTRLHDEMLRARLASVDLKDETALFGLFLGGSKTLAAFAGSGPVNSDDRPIVAFEAPRAAYASSEPPGLRLIDLVHAMRPESGDVLDAKSDSTEGHRLADYWRARDRFLEIGVHMPRGADTSSFIAQIAPQLIDVARMSADFDAAYGPVLAMAQSIARTDPAQARRLLEQLDLANPARHDAQRLLDALPPD
jgi:spermidine synthase